MRSHKDCLRQFKIAVEHLRRLHVAVPQETSRNRDFIFDLFEVTIAIWMDVSHTPSLVSNRWVSYLCSKPLLDTVQAFKEIDYALISEQHDSYARFKDWLGENYGDWGCQIMAPLKGNLLVFFDHAIGLKWIRTALRFMTRANLPDPIGLEEDAAAKWIIRAERPWIGISVDAEAAEVMRIFPRSKGWSQFSDQRKRTLPADAFVGRFGPGASAWEDRHDLVTKYTNFRYDRRLAYVAQRVHAPVDELPHQSLSHLKSDFDSEVTFAPKWLDTLRVISMEPSSYMFYQLGAARDILRRIRRSEWANHIDLEKPELNVELAYDGSISGEFATIDLSNASDNNRLDFVRRIIEGTCLRDYLLLRTSRAVYDGGYYYPTYFAPMGSGLCFPMECIAFASVVSAVMRRHRDRRAWRVYGDDIIVPSDRYDEVCDRLEILGHEVNRDKSFTGSSCFRESCGGDFFSGTDCRPIYVSRFWQGFPTTRDEADARITGCIDLANRMVEHHFTRSVIITKIKKVCPSILFCDDPEKGLWSPSPSNFHLKGRYNGGPDNSGLQRWEYKCQYLGTGTPLRKEQDEEIRLFEWHRQKREAPGRVAERPTEVRACPPPHLRWGWRSPAPGWCPAEPR